jgi:hypothetical protein
MSREEKLAALEAEFDCFPPDYIERGARRVPRRGRGGAPAARGRARAESARRRPRRRRGAESATICTSDDEDDAPPAFSCDLRRRAALPREYFDGVEDLAPYMWFHGMVRAEDCERLLQGKPPGSFFVRNSSRPDHFVIVWMTVDKTTGAAGASKSVHILVQPHKNGGLSVDTGNRHRRRLGHRHCVSSRLADVIDHYSKHLLQTFAPVRAGGMCDDGAGRVSRENAHADEARTCRATAPRGAGGGDVVVLAGLLGRSRRWWAAAAEARWSRPSRSTTTAC